MTKSLFEFRGGQTKQKAIRVDTFGFGGGNGSGGDLARKGSRLADCRTKRLRFKEVVADLCPASEADVPRDSLILTRQWGT